MNNTVSQIVSALLSFDEVTILTHIRPDGDTLGSAFALCRALQKVGKKAQVVCHSEISPRYAFLAGGKSNIRNSCFGNIVSVDVADPKMVGETYAEFAEFWNFVGATHAGGYSFPSGHTTAATAAMMPAAFGSPV